MFFFKSTCLAFFFIYYIFFLLLPLPASLLQKVQAYIAEESGAAGLVISPVHSGGSEFQTVVDSRRLRRCRPLLAARGTARTLTAGLPWDGVSELVSLVWAGVQQTGVQFFPPFVLNGEKSGKVRYHMETMHPIRHSILNPTEHTGVGVGISNCGTS